MRKIIVNVGVACHASDVRASSQCLGELAVAFRIRRNDQDGRIAANISKIDRAIILWKRILLALTVGVTGCVTDELDLDDEIETTTFESELSGGTVPVYLRDLMVWDTHDSFDTRIYVKCTTGSGRTTNQMFFDYIDDTDAHIMNKKLVFTTGSAVLYESEGYVSCKVMESDDSTADDVQALVQAFLAVVSSDECLATDAPRGESLSLARAPPTGAPTRPARCSGGSAPRSPPAASPPGSR